MRILIAAKQESLREALKTLLLTRPAVEIAYADTDNGDLPLQVKAIKPELLLLDEDLSQNLVEDIIAPAMQIDPELMIVVLGKRQDSRMTYLDAGAVAFASKSDSPTSLLTAIEEVRPE